ncbi:MAG: tRNA lysidine(34) synthetase TilS [Pseudomonadota bacterium]
MKLDHTLLGAPETARLGVAVSGGADSFCLLHALWAEGYRLLALTVDHGLRADARKEAEAVAAWCSERSIPHKILTWEGDKPTSGLQAAARAERYRLLISACTMSGIDRLVTGHTIDDQAETLFMRLRRGSGAGLGGMHPKMAAACGAGVPIQLLRPLLAGVRRKEAVAYAHHHGLPVAVDPSNDDDGYERVRVRGLLAALDQQELLSPHAMARTSARVQGMVAHEAYVLTKLLERVGDQPLPGVVHIDFSEGGDVPDLQKCALLSRVVSAIGTPVLPDEVPLKDGLSTIAGTVVEKKASEVWVYREPAMLVGRADQPGGLGPQPVGEAPTLWDRRYIVHPPKPEKAAPTSSRSWVALGQYLPNQIVTSTRARRQLAGIPAICADKTITHVPKWAMDALTAALSAWKDAPSFLNGILAFEADSLFCERVADRVIRH